MKLSGRMKSLLSQIKNESKTKWRMVGMTALVLPLLLWAFSFVVQPAIGDDTPKRGGTFSRKDRVDDGTREHRHEDGREPRGRREGGVRTRFDRGDKRIAPDKRHPDREMLEMMRDLHREMKMLRQEIKELRNEMNGGKKIHRDRPSRGRDFERRDPAGKRDFKRPFREKKDPHTHREGRLLEPR